MHSKVWNSCLMVFKDNLENSTYKAFFEPIKPIRLQNGVLLIEVPTMFFYEFIEEHYIDLLKKTIVKFLGPEAKLEYRVRMGNNAPSAMGVAPATVTLSSRDHNNIRFTNHPVSLPMPEEEKKFNPFVIPGLKKISIDPQLNPEYSMSNFVEGECNRLARSAGMAIAENPGITTFNPLFIHGASGLGKSHLAQAIGIQVKEQHPDKIVLYVNANKFQTQFQEAKIKNDIPNFLHFYQLIDILVIDDVHDISGKEKTQNVFFHIFNHLHQKKKQIIMTSDKSPADLQDIEERLLSRFKWGLTTEIRTPDLNTRIKILRQKTLRDGIDIPEEVIDYVARKVTTNVRELEGALISLLAEATLNKKSITMELAEATMDKLIRHSKHDISIDYIKKTVCTYYNVPEDLLLSNTRKREIVTARQVTMYFSKSLTKNALANIGAQIGHKNHATVLHACKTINNLIETDKKFRLQLEEIESKLRK